MRIGLVSDTHGYLHPELTKMLAGCDAILHAGDVGAGPDGMAILDALEAVAPVYAVWGNIDDAAMRRRVSEWQDVTLGGVRFVMVHIGGRPGRWASGVGPRLSADPPAVFVAGHSHILQVERVASLGRMLFVNPGAAGRQGFHRVKTCVRLVLEGGKAVQAEAVHLDE